MFQRLKNSMNICLLLVLVCLVSCAKVSTLGLRQHQFSQKPKQVIWFQIPGLNDEHIAMLKYSQRETSRLIALEDFQCSGRMWNFNLYELRPAAELGLLSQMTGSKNIRSSCGNLPERPFWDYFSEQGYRVGIFEAGASEQQSIWQSRSCAQASPQWSQNLTLWLSQKSRESEDEFFHYQERRNFNAGAVYYDRACQQGKVCHTSLYDNTTALWQRFKGDRGMSVFVVRDFSYYNALEKKDINLARERLAEIEKTLAYFMHDEQVAKDTLILVTSTHAKNFEFPREGREWDNFERRGQHVIFRNSSLTSLALAKGPRAENFCGLFDENEVMGRMFFTPEDKNIPKALLEIF